MARIRVACAAVKPVQPVCGLPGCAYCQVTPVGVTACSRPAGMHAGGGGQAWLLPPPHLSTASMSMLSEENMEPCNDSGSMPKKSEKRLSAQMIWPAVVHQACGGEWSNGWPSEVWGGGDSRCNHAGCQAATLLPLAPAPNGCSHAPLSSEGRLTQPRA